MNPTSSYDVDASHGDADAEMQRLATQARSGWEREARALARSGLKDGMKVLELGSGPGYMTEQLLALLPASPITALEVNPTLIEKARQHLQGPEAERVTFVEASIMDTGLPDGRFDFAIARFLFQHLPDPVGAAREVRRVLKPGGKLLVIDIDDGLFGIVDPPIDELPRIVEQFGQAQAARGGNRLIGRRLWRILAAAGFERLEMDLLASHSDPDGVEPFLVHFDPDRLRPLVEQGLVSAEELEGLRASLQQFRASDDSFILFVTFVVSGEKPR